MKSLKPLATIFYVYMYFDLAGNPRWVGKGHGARCRDHLKKSHSAELAVLVAVTGGVLPLVMVREGLSEAEAFAVEIALIAAIGRQNLGTGPLFNRTDGGEGSVGLVLSDGVKAKIGQNSRDRWADPVQRAAIIEAQRRGRATPEYREKRSQISQRITADPEFRAGMSQRGRDRFSDLKERERISQLTIEAMTRPEVFARQSAGQKNRFARSEERERLSRKATGRVASDETRARMSASKNGHTVSEETREKLRVAMQNYSDEAKAKISHALKGRVRSPEHAAKLSAAMKDRYRRLRELAAENTICPQ